MAAALAVGLAVASVAAPGLATAAPGTARMVTVSPDETTPGGDPTDESTPPVEPTTTGPDPTTAPPTLPPEPEPTTPSVPPTTSAPKTTAPVDPVPTTTSAPASTTTAPAPGPRPTTTSGQPDQPPPPVLPAPPDAGGGPAPDPAQVRTGVRVTTRDVTLTPAYWNAESTVTSLRVTVANTGGGAEQVRLSYTLPVGLTDAGTPGCAASGGGHWRCGEWAVAPGARFSSLIRVRVSDTAWRRMPLSGAVQVVATGANGSAADNEGFAVLFPPGPPVSGMTLDADEVAFDISGGPSALSVRLGNTGTVDATGRIEVVLPAGVTVPAPPAGCVPAASGRTRCDVGTLPAGRTATLRLPVAATPEAQREAPLAGAVVGRLDPRSGAVKQMQMSFRITAAAALSTPPVATPTPTGSQGVIAVAERTGDGAGLSSTQRIAVVLIAVSALLVVLALALATSSLRRRMGGPVTDRSATPTSD